MSRRTLAQVALMVIAMILWLYGLVVDDERLRLYGIFFMIPAFLLRFFRPRA